MADSGLYVDNFLSAERPGTWSLPDDTRENSQLG